MESWRGRQADQGHVMLGTLSPGKRPSFRYDPTQEPRDLHVMQILGVEWAKSGDGGNPLLTVELSDGEQDWLIGLTEADARLLQVMIGRCLGRKADEQG